MNSCAFACRAASSTSGSVASCLPSRIFSRTESLKQVCVLCYERDLAAKVVELEVG